MEVGVQWHGVETMGGVYDSTKPGNPKYVKAKINIIFCKNFRKLINVNFDFIHLNLCVE